MDLNVARHEFQIGVCLLIRRIKEPGKLIAFSEGHQFRSGCVVLEPGGEVGEHATETGQELIIILEGIATVIADGERGEATAPSEVLIPIHTIHNIKNEFHKPLKYIYIVSTNKNQ